MDLLQLLFSFSGRINRQPYWLVGIAAGVVPAVISMGAGLIESETVLLIGVIGYFIAALWIGIALAVKRAHDRGRSGLFVLLFLVPLLNFWPMVELYFLPGTSGQNEYGVDPLGG